MCSLRVCVSVVLFAVTSTFIVLLNPLYVQIHIDLAPNIEVDDIQKPYIQTHIYIYIVKLRHTYSK